MPSNRQEGITSINSGEALVGVIVAGLGADEYGRLAD
jgi:hypothetical protein